MGQIEILEYLRNERIKGNHGFIYPVDVEKWLRKQGYNDNKTHIKLLQLYNYGYLDIDVENKVKGKPWLGHRKRYRIKEKYV